MSNRFLSTNVMLLAVVSFCIASSAGPVFATDDAKFQECPCKHELAENSKTICGYLIVPENRNNANSRRIKIYLTIYKNPKSHSESGPLLFLTGGPGASTAQAVELFENKDNNPYIKKTFVDTFRDNRDLIVVDQRGTNYSVPALYCSQETAGLRRSMYGSSFSEQATARVEAVEACYERLSASGIDLSAYNTFENAADIKDLRDTLGYDTVNLFGVSYGTRLSMTIMKLYPEILRSVVLDSVLPPEVNPFDEQPAGVMYALKSFFRACKTDFPDTEEAFYEIITRLQGNPVNTIGHGTNSKGKPIQALIPVDAQIFVSYVMGQLRSTPYDASLPLNIAKIYETQDYSVVADAWIGNTNYLFAAGKAGTDAPSLGMFESMAATSDGHYTTPSKVLSMIYLAMDNPAIQGWARNSFIYSEPAIQRLWEVTPVSPDIQYPVISNIPTMLLSGSIDSGTPPVWAQDSARYLSHSFVFTILAGHATTYLGCAAKMMDDFLNDPSTRPTYQCPTTYAWKKAATDKGSEAGPSLGVQPRNPFDDR
ncbi:MAG: alpha/beta fold hydrolase [Acidobacteriota bacterium]